MNISLVALIIQGTLVPSWVLTSGTSCNLVKIESGHLGAEFWGEPVEGYVLGEDGPLLVRPKVDGVAYVYLVSPVMVSPQNCEFWLLSESSRPLSVGDTAWHLKTSIDLNLVMREGVVMMEEVTRVESLVLKPTGLPPTPPPKAVPKSVAQDTALLQVIGHLGHEPMSLPKNAKGRPGVKAEIKRVALKQNGLFTASSFKHAWERLSKSGDILYGD